MKVLLPDKMKRKESSKLLFQELKENPYRQLNLAFFLISVIPILAIIYLMHSQTLVCIESLSDISRIIILICVIVLLGYTVGYKVMRSMIDKTLTYAARAKKADETKSTFAMSLAHDLKSPLSTIKTNISGLNAGYMGELTKEQKGAVSVCDETSDRMNSMIAELISNYTMEARGAKLSIDRFDLKEILEKQHRELESAAAAKKIIVSMDLSVEPVIIEADKDKMVRVINNILNNSIKYTPQGGKIKVKAFAAEGFARIEFFNNGAPIPEDRLEKIFDKFERLDTSVEGHGLGLAISKDIVELHKGRVWAESRPGSMNCFTVLLPLAPAKRTISAEGLKRVLIVEDDKNFAGSIAFFLSDKGYEVIKAYDAKTGIEYAGSKNVNLIILDLNLGHSDTDGISVLESLRNMPETADIPVIISTSNPYEGIERKVRALGADGFIRKPYDIEKLLSKIKTLLI